MAEMKSMPEEQLDLVTGGVEIGIPTGKDNTREFRKEELDRMWNVIKQRKEWEFKDRELELQSKKMWLDALLGNGAVTSTLNSVIPNLLGMGGNGAKGAN